MPMLEACGTRKVVVSKGIAGNGDSVATVKVLGSDDEGSVGEAVVEEADCRWQKDEWI